MSWARHYTMTGCKKVVSPICMVYTTSEHAILICWRVSRKLNSKMLEYYFSMCSCQVDCKEAIIMAQRKWVNGSYIAEIRSDQTAASAEASYSSYWSAADCSPASRIVPLRGKGGTLWRAEPSKLGTPWQVVFCTQGLRWQAEPCKWIYIEQWCSASRQYFA